MAREDTKRYSAAQLERLRARGDFVPSRRDAPVREPDAAFWRRAKLVLPEPKKSIHLRVDADVLDWFRDQGQGHLTRMNAVLRGYMEAQRGRRR